MLHRCLRNSRLSVHNFFQNEDVAHLAFSTVVAQVVTLHIDSPGLTPYTVCPFYFIQVVLSLKRNCGDYNFLYFVTPVLSKER